MKVLLCILSFVALVCITMVVYNREAFVPSYYPRDIPKPGKWFREYQAICAAYYPTHSVPPTKPQDCYDSTFAFTTDMSRLVRGEGRYPGCAQVTNDTNYCYSNQQGEYVPNYPQLFYNPQI